MNFVWFSAQCVPALFDDDAQAESSEIITRAFANVRKILFCTKAPKTDRFRKINMENEIFSYLFSADCHVLHLIIPFNYMFASGCRKKDAYSLRRQVLA